MAEPIHEYRITSHAVVEMERRGIDRTMVHRVLAPRAAPQRAGGPRRAAIKDYIRRQNLFGAGIRGRGSKTGERCRRIPHEQARKVLEI